MISPPVASSDCQRARSDKLTSQQLQFLQVFREADGMLYEVFKSTGVNRSILNEWSQKNIHFKLIYTQETEAAEERQIRFAEYHLFSAVRKGNQKLTRFVLKEYGGQKMLSEIFAGRNPYTKN